MRIHNQSLLYMDLCFVARLPVAVLSELVQYCPFVSWGRFVITCKGLHALFGHDKLLGSHIYREIKLNSDCSAIAATFQAESEPLTTLRGLYKYLQHTHRLSIIRVPGFSDYCLRILHPHCPSVTSLNLHNLPGVLGWMGTQIGQTDWEEGAKLGLDGRKTAPLSVLTPTETPTKSTALELWTQQLTSLTLSAIAIKDDTMHNLARHMTRLESLTLTSSITSESLISIGTYATRLHHLTLDGSWKIKYVQFEAWASTVPQELQTLSLRSCENVSDLTLTRLLVRCGSNLKYLNIKFNEKITQTGLQAIRLSCPNLTHLSASHLEQNIPMVEWTSNLLYVPHLTYLDVSINPGVTDEAVEMIASSCTRLQNLNLRGTPITDSAIASIAKYCSLLMYLDTSACNNIKSFPDLDRLPNISRLSIPECKSLSLQLLYPQFETMGASLQFVVKYDLSFTSIDDRCLQLLIQHAYWLSHLSAISCTALTDESINTISNLLSSPRFTASYFALGICLTPLISHKALRSLKVLFCPNALALVEQSALCTVISNDISAPSSASTSPTELPRVAAVAASISSDWPSSAPSPANLSEDRMSINCNKGGIMRQSKLCQCWKKVTLR